MSDELSELLRQKKELEQRIKILRTANTTCRNVKLDKAHYTSCEDEWFLAIYQEDIRPIPNRAKGRWQSVFRSTDREKVVDAIDDIIQDLKGLKEKLNEGN